MPTSFSLDIQSVLYDQSPIAISVSSAESFKFLFVNNAWCELWGYSRKEAIGKTPAELGILELTVMVKLAETFFKDGKVTSQEIPARKQNGEPVCVLGFGETVMVNQELCALKFMVDVTEVKRAAGSKSGPIPACLA